VIASLDHIVDERAIATSSKEPSAPDDGVHLLNCRDRLVPQTAGPKTQPPESGSIQAASFDPNLVELNGIEPSTS
jgi:hypothetical protein